MAEFLKSWRLWAILILSFGFGLRLSREVQLLRAAPVTSWETTQTADCAVVLTGGPGRVREGFDLLVEGRVKKLIISGVHPEVKLREMLPVWPFYAGLYEQDVVLEKRSESTWGNAQQSLPIVEALRCRDLLLVTSRLHMHRASQTFRRVFPEYIAIHPQSVVGARLDPGWDEPLVEALKSLFYAIWAY